MKTDLYYLQKYLSDIGPPEPLTSKKEQELLKKYHTDKDDKIINQLLLRNQYIVIQEVLYFAGKSIEIFDLIQYANLICIEALKRNTNKVGLKNYLHRNIYRGLCNQCLEISSLMHYPLNIVSGLHQYMDTVSEFYKMKGEMLTPDDVKRVSMEMGIDLEIIDQLYFNESFLEGKIYSYDDYQDAFYYRDNSFYELDTESFVFDLDKQFKSLKKQEMDVVKAYHGIDREIELTLQELGTEYGLTRERIRQIKENAIRKLQHKSRSKHIRPYLDHFTGRYDVYNIFPKVAHQMFIQSDEEREMVKLLNDYVAPRKRKTNYKNLSRILRKKIYKFMSDKKRPCSFTEISSFIMDEYLDINPLYFTYALKSSMDIVKIKKGTYCLKKWEKKYKYYKEENRPGYERSTKKIKTPEITTRININYIDICKKSGIVLDPNDQYLLEQFEKKEGKISTVWLNSLSKIKRVDFNSVIYRINSVFRNQYSKDLIIYDEDAVSWETNYYFDNSENWGIAEQTLLVREKSIEYNDEQKSSNDKGYPDYVIEQADKIKNIFDHTVTTYKFYWFLSLLSLVEQGRKEATFYEMAALMCAHAWKDVLVFGGKYNDIDQIPKLIRKIYLSSHLERNVNISILQNYLCDNLGKIAPIFNPILNMVPYRFLSVFMDNLTGIKDYLKNNLIYKKCQNRKYMYWISLDKLQINDDWYNYLHDNRILLEKFIINSLKRNINCSK